MADTGSTRSAICIARASDRMTGACGARAARRIAGRALVDDVNLVADGADERCLAQRDGLGQPLAGGEHPCLVHDRPRRRVVADPRSAEWPARAGGHVDAELEAPRLAQRVVEHLHPRGDRYGMKRSSVPRTP